MLISDYFRGVKRQLNLEFIEYIVGGERPKYRFHLKDENGEMIFRYDNALHHRGVSTFSHRKHALEGVKPSRKIGFKEGLKEVERYTLK